MTVSYCKRNQVVTPTAAAVSVVVLWPEGINTLLDIWHAPIDLTNYFLPPQYLLAKTTRSTLCSAGKDSNMPSLSYLGDISSTFLYNNLAHLPKDITIKR